MEQEKHDELRGPLGLRLPISYEVSLKRLPDGSWSLIYVEEHDMQSLTEEQITKAIENQNKLFGTDMQLSAEGNKVTLKGQGKRNSLAAGMMMEFMAATDMGKMSISELVVLATLGASKLEALKDEVMKIIQEQQAKEKEQMPSACVLNEATEKIPQLETQEKKE
jgi:hypothetical protein